jgi:hypothetical protein
MRSRTTAMFSVVLVACALVACGDAEDAPDRTATEVESEPRQPAGAMCSASGDGLEDAIHSFGQAPMNAAGDIGVVGSLDEVARFTQYSDAHLGVIRGIRRLEDSPAFQGDRSVAGGSIDTRLDGSTAAIETADGQQIYAQLVTSLRGDDEVDLSSLVGACAVVFTDSDVLDGRIVSWGRTPYLAAVAPGPTDPPRAFYPDSDVLVAGGTSIEAFAERAKSMLTAPCGSESRRRICGWRAG